MQEFAGLGDFMDLPVRIYSSRHGGPTGFALATAVRPQILLMDEWFLAGDSEFLEKARARLEDMVRGAEILVLSTHVPADRADLVHARNLAGSRGEILADGRARRCDGEYLGHPALPAPEPE